MIFFLWISFRNPKTSLLTARLWWFSTMFSSRSWIGLALTCRSSIFLKCEIRFHSFSVWIFSCFIICLLKALSFNPSLILTHLTKIGGSYMHFWTPCSVSLICLYTLNASITSLDYCSFIKFLNCCMMTLAFTLAKLFSIFYVLWFPYNC